MGIWPFLVCTQNKSDGRFHIERWADSSGFDNKLGTQALRSIEPDPYQVYGTTVFDRVTKVPTDQILADKSGTGTLVHERSQLRSVSVYI